MRYITLLIISVLLFNYWQDGPFKQGDPAEQKPTNAVTVKAEKRGYPNVSLADGYDLAAPVETNGGAQAVALVAGDFDSDGTEDLVTADQTGQLSIYHGVAQTGDLPHAHGVQKKDAQPFQPAGSTPALGFVPAYLAAGDFNADGRTDILTAAKDAEGLTLLGGDGHGKFAAPYQIKLRGTITALATGEIGRADGLTDIAVAVTNSKGTTLYVFEYPEGALKAKPEIFKFAAPVTDITIGNLDDDFYADIAVASGAQLMIIHGRGQAYPWDLDKRFGIERPKAVVAVRTLPFTIAALAAGDFGDAPGDSLAVLSEAGVINILSPLRGSNPSNFRLPKEAKMRAGAVAHVPAGAGGGRYAFFDRPEPIDVEAARRFGLTLIAPKLPPRERMEAAEKLRVPNGEKLARLTAEARAQSEESRPRAKEAFLRTISALPSTLAAWRIETLISDARLAGAANSHVPQKMIKARASGSGRDDLVLIDAAGKQIHIVTQSGTADSPAFPEIATLEVESEPTAVLPVRLNADALSDLVVLRQGAAAPNIVETAAAQTFTVNTTSDGQSDCSTPGQPCTLRHAIQLANANPGADQISFNIFGCGPHTIQPLSELPVITQAVTIFGGSQPCSSPSSPRIEINGALLGEQAADGLKVRASNCFISGLSITGFQGVRDPDTGSLSGGNGIALETPVGFARSANNFVANNFLGVAPDGTTDRGNLATGLLIFDSDSNNIQSNTISGNDGAGIAVTNGNNNIFWANKIGTNAAGTAKLPNDSIGLLLGGKNNQVGGDGENQGNTISGNGKMRPEDDTSFTLCTGRGVGIYALVSLETGEQLTSGNTLKGNRIGTDPSGTQPLGNCLTGIEVAPITATTIGSITQGGRNVISDNGYDAIHCDTRFDPFFGSSEGGFCSISGNNIGTDVTGAVAMGNDWRGVRGGAEVSGISTVFVYNNNSLSNVGAPGGTTPGGDCTGFCNLVSGSGVGGSGAVGRIGFGTVGIFNNFIGTNKSGTAALPNDLRGIHVEGNDTFIGGYITEGNVNLGNLISGNTSGGIGLFPEQTSFASTFDIEANLIGTDITGASAIPNGINDPDFGAVAVTAFENKTINIGGVNLFSRNVISGNNTNGIRVFGAGGTTNIINNYVGLSKFNQPLGNAKHGILLVGEGTTVGGTGAGEGNVIYNNTLAGVAVQSFAGPGGSSNALNHTIRGNSIRDNGGLGIDLTLSTSFNAPPDGVTPNDCDDSDEGPNAMQNYPELGAPVTNQNGTVTLAGKLRSRPSKSYTIDCYSNSTGDPTKYGEGETYLGSEQVLTNGFGFVNFSFTTAQSSNITATATDESGNTSEFSCIAGMCVPDATCAVPIVVNNTADDHDADTTDEICDTDTTDANLQCSLRAAIEQAEAIAGPDDISFNIPGDAPFLIAPQTAYPTIEQQVSIDASTQPGYNGSPVVAINGQSIGPNNYGLALKGGNSVVRGLSIVNFYEGLGFGGGGTASGENRAQSNYIGVFPDGTPGDNAKQRFGITLVGGTTHNLIGGDRATEGNVISACEQGITISNGSERNRIQGNLIGTDPTGTQRVPNTVAGIALTAANNNVIGSAIAGQGNLISGNNGDGILIDINSNQNKVVGNVIGLDKFGLTALTNNRGVRILGGSSENLIGGTTLDERNVISGNNSTNNSAGVHITGTAGLNNQVTGNLIGFSADESLAIPNHIGIAVNADSQVIGSDDPSAYKNRIIADVSQFGYGIYLHSFAPDNDELRDVVVQNNEVGIVHQNQTHAGWTGIYLFENVTACTIKGNTVGWQAHTGIRLFNGPHNNTIVNNRVGLDPQDNPIPNRNGIAIRQADVNFIKDNITSGNTSVGIAIGDTLGNPDPEVPTSERTKRPNGNSTLAINNIVTGNKVGVSGNGQAQVPNGQIGIGVGAFAQTNRIGGPGAERNVVGGNSQDIGFGILIGILYDGADDSTLPTGNRVVGNLIGVGASGESLPNKYGIYIRNAIDTVVGGDLSSEGNVVGNSAVDGVRVFMPQAVNTLIKNNFIGVDRDGTGIGNERNGISVERTGPTTIDGNVIADNHNHGIAAQQLEIPQSAGAKTASSPAFTLKIIKNKVGFFKAVNGAARTFANQLRAIELLCVGNALIGVNRELSNVLAGNHETAVKIIKSLGQSPGNGPGDPCPSGFNKIFGNTIGTDESGSPGLGNGGDGIWTEDHDTEIGSSGAGNTIVASGGFGIKIVNGAENFRIIGNMIGATANLQNQLVPLGNGQSGIGVSGGSAGQIGDPASPNLSNVIAANQQYGILLEQVSSLIKVRNNLIGNVVRDLRAPTVGNFGNGADGVLITTGSFSNTVGGLDLGAGNTIVGNAGAGVRVDETAGTGNNIDPNLIYNNNALGIDLGALGITPNDPGDADNGPNKLQNFPEFTSAIINTDGHLVLQYKVASAPGNSNYGAAGIYIEFFKADEGLEGQTFIGSTHYTVSDYNNGSPGMVTFNAGPAAQFGVSSGDNIVATATDADGNTSEFTSTNVGVVAAQTQTSFVVNSTNDPGDGVCNAAECTLREAINAANASVGAETISFNIPAATDAGCNSGTGVCTIAPTSQLPTIVESVTIDGYTQPGAQANTNATGALNAVLKIELSGQNASFNTTGLKITAANTTVRGMVINRFLGSAISFTGAGANGGAVEGNYIGTDVAGTADRGNATGVAIVSGATNNHVGTDGDGAGDAAERNLISGTVDAVGRHVGIGISDPGTSGNVVAGNHIGTNAAGDAVLESGTGVLIQGLATNNRVGTNGDGVSDAIERNVILGSVEGSIQIADLATGNVVAGNYIGTNANGTSSLTGEVRISNAAGNNLIGTNADGVNDVAERNVIIGIRIEGEGTTSNVVAGNYIGVNAAGTAPLAGGGIFFSAYQGDDAPFGPPTNNRIGGIKPGEGNLIAFNQSDGVFFFGGVGNSILSNSIHSNGTTVNDLGIDLGTNGVTPNDPGDADTGDNNLQNFPEFTSAVIDSGGQLVIQYKVDSAPVNSDYGAAGLRVEFFKADSSSPLEGQTFIGSDSYTAADYNAGAPGTKTFNLGAASGVGVAPGDRLVATATDADGNTSEFTSTNVGTVTGGPPGMGSLIISEFRLRGAAGATDEFIEFYNPSDSSVTVGTTDGSAGWALVAADGAVRFFIPNGTVIPARGHYLAVNSNGYSLTNYGDTNAATGDISYTTDIPDGSGLTLFSTSNAANFTMANRFDAAGYTAVDVMYREGAGLASPGANNAEYSLVRKMALTGLPRDTGDNAADFAFVSTDGGIYGGVQSGLGAPGPENSTSPIQRNALIKGSLIDPGCTGNGAAGTACGRVRDTTPDAGNNSALGTLSLRRKFTNNTGQMITRLRFRVVDITTAPQAPNNGTADLRLRSSATIVGATLSGGGTATIQGLMLEEGPNQPSGGGLNSTVSAGTITFAAPLAAGASINVNFLLGVQQSGAYRIYVNVEALP